MNLAEVAYQAYCKQAGGVTFDGKPLPTYAELGSNRQECWEAAVSAVKVAIMSDNEEKYNGNKETTTCIQKLSSPSL